MTLTTPGIGGGNFSSVPRLGMPRNALSSLRLMKGIWTSSLVLGIYCLYTAAADDAQKLKVALEKDCVGLYETVRVTLTGKETKGNPFDPEHVDVQFEVRTPAGRLLRHPAFFMQEFERIREGEKGLDRDWCYPVGSGSWQVRFAPLELGVHEARVRWRDSDGESVSDPVRFTCEPSGKTGFLKVSQRDPRFLEFSNGEPFFGIGQNLAFIGNQQYVTLTKAEELFKKLAANGANYLRIWTGCEDWAIGIEARKSAWGRSWSWNPPFVVCPDHPNRMCVELGRSGATVRVDPSHRVALRPRTRYVFQGKIMVDGDASVTLFGLHLREGRTFEPKAQKVWSPFRHEFVTDPTEYWLTPPTFRMNGNGKAWLDGLSLRQAEGGPELLWEADPNRPVRGYYNQLDCFYVDELVEAAEKSGVYLQLCLLTRDLYMKDLKDPESAAYKRAIEDAKKLMRYAVARWGSSTSVAAWEYWNEMDPGLPTDKLYTEVGQFLDEIDIYHHLRTTSTWGPSAKDCRHPKLDFADTHFYLRPSDLPRLRDEVEAVLGRTQWLREHAPNKPVHLGEFGLANERWQPTPEMEKSSMLVDFHNAIWASALSGSATTALFWWWDRLDRLNHYHEYKPLSTFVADVPWTSSALRALHAKSPNSDIRIVGLQSDNRAWLWIFDPESSWGKVVVEGKAPSPVSGAAVEISSLAEGSYHVRWIKTTGGEVFHTETARADKGVLNFVVPDFMHDVAAKVVPAQ